MKKMDRCVLYFDKIKSVAWIKVSNVFNKLNSKQGVLLSLAFYDKEDFTAFLFKSFFFFDYSHVFVVLPELIIFCFLIYTLLNTAKNKMAANIWKWWLVCFFISFLVCLFVSYSELRVPTNAAFFLGSTLWLQSLYTGVSKCIILWLTVCLVYILRGKFVSVNWKGIQEFFLFIGFATLFMLFLSAANDLIAMYMAIEGLSLSLYVLAARLQGKFIAVEAAIKYFSLGAFSSGVLLYGISIFFGIFGAVDFISLLYLLSDWQHKLLISQNFALNLAFIFIVFGFFFKIGVFPCHMWVPDVYEGVWSPVMAYFAIVVKACLLLFSIRLFFNVFFFYLIMWQKLFIFIAVASIFFGALGALVQIRIKRFIAFTSINQVGFFILGLGCGTIAGAVAAFVYLLLYATTSLLLFGVILESLQVIKKKPLIYLSDLYSLGLNKHNQWLARFFVVATLSMAGLPPLGGFFGKLFLYYAMIGSALDTVALFTLFINVISTFYYVNLIRYLWFEKQGAYKFLFYLNINHSSIFRKFLYSISLGLAGFVFLLPCIYYSAFIIIMSAIAPFSLV